MKKIIYLFLTLISFAFAFKPTIDVTLNNTHLLPKEKLEITIEVVAPKESKVIMPKINSIHGYKVKRVIKHSVINAEEKGNILQLQDVQAVYQLYPLDDITVGPFTIMIDDKIYKTKEYKVFIIKNHINKKKKEHKVQQISLQVTTNKKEVFVGEEFIITYKLIRPMNLTISQQNFILPQMSEFNFYKLHEPISLIKGNMIETTMQYVAIPKEAGVFTLPPAKYKYSVELVPQVQSSFDIFSQNTVIKKSKELMSDTLKIKVKKLPQSVDAIGRYKLKVKLDKFVTQANKPLKFIVEIFGEGDLHLLKMPNMQIENVTLFPKEPIIKKEFRNNKLFTILLQEYIYISNEDFTIPAINLKVFDPKSKKIYFLKSQAIKINVINTLSLNDILHQSKSERKKEEKTLFDMNYYKKKVQEYNSNIIKRVLSYILGVITGVLITIYFPLLFNLFKKRGKRENIFKNYKEAFNILYPHTTESPKIEEMVKMLYEVLNGNEEVKIDDKELNKLIKKVLKKI